MGSAIDVVPEARGVGVLHHNDIGFDIDRSVADFVANRFHGFEPLFENHLETGLVHVVVAGHGAAVVEVLWRGKGEEQTDIDDILEYAEKRMKRMGVVRKVNA